MNVTTHIGLVVVDIAIVQRDCAAANVDATSSVLPAGANIALSERRAPQRGDGKEYTVVCLVASAYVLRRRESTSKTQYGFTPSGRWGGHGRVFGGVLQNARKTLCSSRSGRTET